MTTARARARTNIALVKYWGKSDPRLNLPATGSISLTLSSMRSTTKVTFDDRYARDEMILDGARATGIELSRVSRFLDLVRELANDRRFALVETENSFPTAGGLASSAAGFAALAAAAAAAAGLDLPPSRLAGLARRGSGSAARSLYGGFVELRRDEVSAEGTAVLQLAPPEHWNVRLVIAITSRKRKKIGSTEGMERSRATSPFYSSWLATHEDDMEEARCAIRDRDLSSLGKVIESSCFKMHAVALASYPTLLYWNPTTVELVAKVWEMRQAGLEGYITIDAGPQVKVFCLVEHALQIKDELSMIGGVEQVLVEEPGPGVEYLT